MEWFSLSWVYFSRDVFWLTDSFRFISVWSRYPQQYSYLDFGELWALVWECSFILREKILSPQHEFISISLGVPSLSPGSHIFFLQEVFIASPSHSSKWQVSLFEQPILPPVNLMAPREDSDLLLQWMVALSLWKVVRCRYFCYPNGW